MNNLNLKYKISLRSGFTLLEILLVVGIISILAGIVIVAINPGRQLALARNTERRSDLKQINSALQQYYIDHREYPAGLTDELVDICDTGNTASSSVDDVFGVGYCDDLLNLSVLVPTYLTAIPKDPQATTTTIAGYKVIRHSSNGKIGLKAVAELGLDININIPAEEEVIASVCEVSGDATDPDCWSIQVGEENYSWGPTPSYAGVSNNLSLANGKANTAILYGLGFSYPAGYYCYTLTQGGVSAGTWYLPSGAELVAGWRALGDDGFPDFWYWSSTENSDKNNLVNYSWGLFTGDEIMWRALKSSQSSVRCLR